MKMNLSLLPQRKSIEKFCEKLLAWMYQMIIQNMYKIYLL